MQYDDVTANPIWRSYDQNTKFRKFKMAVGGHFENGLIVITQPGIIRFQHNLVCMCNRK